MPVDNRTSIFGTYNWIRVEIHQDQILVFVNETAPVFNSSDYQESEPEEYNMMMAFLSSMPKRIKPYFGSWA